MTTGSPVSDALRLPAGPVDLASHDPAATPLAPGGKSKTKAAFAAHGEELFELGELLFAQGGADRPPRLLVILQGMDASGKGGAVKHVGGQLNPQVLHVAGFGPPTDEESAHHFLWRVRRRLPPPARIGFFDRSHYEDVLVPRVHGLVPPGVWEDRHAEINAFEQELLAEGYVLLKAFLHISPGEQLERMQARLDRPHKRWKYNPGDLDERERWPRYVEAYEAALELCSTPGAPWHVIPADRKWYRNWALGQMIAETLRGMGLRYPERPDLDLEAERRRLTAAAGSPAVEAPEPG